MTIFYDFPIIKKLDDVLPHLEGYSEFIVAEREFGTVVNYNVQMNHTFDMSGPNDLGGAIRRECRGLIFDRSGFLMSRPFHKFFNVGEREETMPAKIDLSQEHRLEEKLDGSMIRPILHEGRLRLGTKMGITDVSIQCEDWLKAQPDYERKMLEMHNMFLRNKTPLYEFVSPENLIVLKYEKADLILMSIRDNVTGVYEELPPVSAFTKVPSYSSLTDLDKYIASARTQTEREGDILSFANGHKFKIKNDWYVRIHKVKDRIRFERNIVHIILENELDDVLGIVGEEDRKTLTAFAKNFWTAVDNKLLELELKVHMIRSATNDDRKKIALEHLPKHGEKLGQYVFRTIQDENLTIREILMEQITKNIASNAKWDAFKGFLYGDHS